MCVLVSYSCNWKTWYAGDNEVLVTLGGSFERALLLRMRTHTQPQIVSHHIMLQNRILSNPLSQARRCHIRLNRSLLIVLHSAIPAIGMPTVVCGCLNLFCSGKINRGHRFCAGHRETALVSGKFRGRGNRSQWMLLEAV